MTDPAPFRYKPTRAEVARANGALSRGPATEAGKARSRLNGLAHGLRAQRLLPVAALGEVRPQLDAHARAVCHELGAVGPVARHLAETIACCMVRAARAERLEGELLQGVAEGAAEEGGTVATRLHGDVDTRATLALIQRYRHEADRELLQALAGLIRLQAARGDGLLPDAATAAEAEASLDVVAATLRPSEPKVAKILTYEQLEVASTNAVLTDPDCFDGQRLLRRLRELRGRSADAADRWWRSLPEGARRAALDANVGARAPGPGQR